MLGEERLDFGCEPGWLQAVALSGEFATAAVLIAEADAVTDARVLLIETADRVLPTLPPSHRAARSLSSLGVTAAGAHGCRNRRGGRRGRGARRLYRADRRPQRDLGRGGRGVETGVARVRVAIYLRARTCLRRPHGPCKCVAQPNGHAVTTRARPMGAAP
jgi:hypothetical protein